MSPLTMLNASFQAASVLQAQTSCLASTRASVMSEMPCHCACEPGQRNGRPVSLQTEA